MESESPPKENPSPPSRWVSTCGPPVAERRGGRRLRAIPRCGGVAGRVVAPVGGEGRGRRGAPRRFQYLSFRDRSTDESPSPPPSPPRRSLPIEVGRYGNLRPRPIEWPEPTWRPPPPLQGYLEGYVRTPRVLELTPSPPHGDDEDSLRSPPRSPVAAPLRTADWAARRWRLPPAQSSEQTPPLPPLIAVVVEAPKESDSPGLGEPCYYRNSDPIYFPFHPTTEEWDEAEASADLFVEEQIRLSKEKNG